MEKIMKALLEAKYPTLNADVLLDIANHTPNATVAIEKLCGLYIPYTFEQLGIHKVSRDKEPKEYKLVGINEWTGEVTYEYEYEVSEGFYVPKDIDPSIVLTIDNIKEYESKSHSNSKYIYVKTGTMAIGKTTTSIAHWQGLSVPNWVHAH